MEQDKPRWIMHLDMDAFFAAIEQRDDPSLVGKPVIVGARPGTRGVVSTCSYEARRYGIRSAMPIAEAYRKCPHGVYLPPDFKRYQEASDRVMETLAAISPVVEPVGIDEAFVDISGLDRLFGSPEAIGRRAKVAIRQAVRLTASVGIGPNRLVAKIASDFRKPDGLTVVPPEAVLDFLAPLDIARLRGVGKVLVERLHQLGIQTVGQLRRFNEERLAELVGDSAAAMLRREAHGLGSDAVGQERERKQIGKETTFDEDVTDVETLRRTLLRLAGEVGRRARRAGVRGRCITVKIRLAGFETHTRRKTLKEATAIDDAIFATAWSIFQESGFAGRSVRLIGVSLSGWEDSSQLDLFTRPDARRERLMAAKDKIVERFGKGALGLHPSEPEEEEQDE
ncbi:MAG: DNA polymerase IV [Myxococcales bacterium]|nr:MAG: DNA polymerase IV [Myxococcales bacterium]